MPDSKPRWERFQRLRFDSKSLSRRAKKAETSTTKHAHRFVVSKLDSLKSVKRHVVIWLTLIGVLIVAVAAQMMWYQGAYRSMAWKNGGTYAEAVLGPINTLNPLYATTKAEQSAQRLIFSSLYQYDASGSLGDDLARSMTVNDDGTQYTIRIRDDAVWSDDVKLTAADIAFTVNLMKAPQARSVMYNDWVDIKVDELDSTTVRFTLPARYAAFPHALTFAVLPKHVLEDIPPVSLRQSQFSVSPVGSGPYTVRLLQRATDGRHKIANLSASTDYYKGEPRISRFQLHAFADEDSMSRSLDKGDVSAASGIGSARKSITTKQYGLNSGVYALLNNDSTMLKDMKVRKALQQGTNTDGVRKALGYNPPELYLPFVKGQLRGTVPDKPTYDVAVAKRLLDEAGWKITGDEPIRKNAAGQRLTLSVVTTNDSSYEACLKELGNQWRELGVEVRAEVRERDNPTKDFVQTTLQPRDYDVLLYEIVIGVDPDVYAYWHSSQAGRSGFNFSNYKNGISDDALASARSRSEPELRNEKYKAFARQWLNDAPAIGLYQPVLRYSYRDSVYPQIRAGSVPTESDRYNEVMYWSAENTPVYKTP